MATVTVSAVDSATAMDEVFSKLGEDAYILETAKRNGKVEIKATNDPQPVPGHKRRKPSLDKQFSAIFEGNMIGQGDASAGLAEKISTADVLAGRQQSGEDRTRAMIQQVCREEVAGLGKQLEAMLGGMMITDGEGLVPSLGHSLPVQLRQAGFDQSLVRALQESYVGRDHEVGRIAFMRALANKLVYPASRMLFHSRLICVVGPSGAGKTTLATKLAAYSRENEDIVPLTLATLSGSRSVGSETMKAYARMMNMPVVHFPMQGFAERIKAAGQSMVVDISAPPEQVIPAIQETAGLLKDRRVLTVLAIPGGSSKTMINTLYRQYAALDPVIALTKLDECETGPAELSALAENGGGIALLTGTKSIIGAIAIATEAILAQYLKENC